MEGEAINGIVQWIDLAQGITVTGVLILAIYAFYTGRVVPSSSVRVAEKTADALDLLARSYETMARVLVRLCALVEREGGIGGSNPGVGGTSDSLEEELAAIATDIRTAAQTLRDDKGGK